MFYPVNPFLDILYHLTAAECHKTISIKINVINADFTLTLGSSALTIKIVQAKWLRNRHINTRNVV